jgi:signal transduction histidine kinase
MVAGISHELNTPIGIVVTLASAMADNTKVLQQPIAQGDLKRSELATILETQYDMENLVLRSMTRAADLISSFKQVAADRASEQRREFDLKAVIEDIAASLRPSMKDQLWQLQLDIPDQIVCDSFPGPLGQIVTNLVQNAAIHAFGGRMEGNICIHATHAGDEVLLRVQDNGIGMDAHIAKHAFDPFFTTRMGRGSGLGLSIAHRIATATLGGSLALEKTPNAGTCFTLRLPGTALRQDPLKQPQVV